MGAPEERKGIFEVIMTKFSKINDRLQTTDPGKSENSKQDKHPSFIPRHVAFKLQKIKDRARRETMPYL